MSKREDVELVRAAIDARFSRLRGDPALAQRVMRQETKGEMVMRRKTLAGFAAAAAALVFAVTAMAAGGVLPGLLELLFGREAPGMMGGMVVQLDDRTAETAYARVNVHELLYDGIGAYVAVDLAPIAEDILLLPATLEEKIGPNSPAQCLGLADAGDETTAEYAARTGRTMVYTVVMLDDDTTLGLSLTRAKDLRANGDGTWTIAMRMVTGGEESRKLKLQCSTFRLTSVEEVPDDLKNTNFAEPSMRCWAPMDENSGEASIDLALDAVTPPTEVRTMASCEEVVKLRGIEVTDVTLTRTPVAVYLDVVCEITNETDTDFLPGVFTNAALTEKPGEWFVPGYQIKNQDGKVHALQCYPVTAPFPDELWVNLLAYHESDSGRLVDRDAGTVHVVLK